jgi:N-acetylglucosamine malate deacetylase 1
MARPDFNAADFFEPLESGYALSRLVRHKQLHLVIAPHPDDDVIGAGGMMALLARSRRPVVTVYVTTGAPAGNTACRSVYTRRQEALAALRVVKAQGAFFMDCTSRDVLDQPSRVRAVLMNIIALLCPCAVYVPWPLEQHATHQAVTRMAVQGLRRLGPFAGEIWGYCVWSALPPSLLRRSVDITRVAHLKRAAIEQHASQIALKDYAGGILGLNRHAAVYGSPLPDNHTSRYAEQFLDMRMLVQKRGPGMAGFIRRVFAVQEVSARTSLP